MNFPKLEREILQAIRGTRSQMDLSNELGFKFNQVYRFERGIVRLSWSDFVSICNCCGIDLKSIFGLFLDRRLEMLNVAKIIEILIVRNELTFVAKQIQRPKRTIQRWLNGESEPDFQDVLRLIYKFSNWIFEFASQLTSNRDLPSFASEMSARRVERAFHFDHPEFAAIVRSFELTEYEQLKIHSDSFVAKKSGLTTQQVKQLIHAAMKIGIIKKEQGKYLIVNKSLSTAGDIEGKRKVVTHWMNRQLKGIELTPDFTGDPVKSSYLVFTASPLILEKVKTLTQDYFHALVGVLHDDENRSAHCPLDRVMLMQLNLMNIEHLKEL